MSVSIWTASGNPSKEGRWVARDLAHEIYIATNDLAIVGGIVGRTIARRLRPFWLTVAGKRIRIDQGFCAEDELLLGEAQVVLGRDALSEFNLYYHGAKGTFEILDPAAWSADAKATVASITGGSSA